MIGLVGEVIESLEPEGVIKVGNEYWQAQSLNGDIAAGEDVEVRGIDRLTLEVKRKV